MLMRCGPRFPCQETDFESWVVNLMCACKDCLLLCILQPNLLDGEYIFQKFAFPPFSVSFSIIIFHFLKHSLKGVNLRRFCRTPLAQPSKAACFQGRSHSYKLIHMSKY